VNCVAGDAATLIAATQSICSAAGARRIVHLSSMAVYGDATGLIEESQALKPGGGWYADAKIACEALAVRAGAVILRPGCIHGPRGESWTGRIGRLLGQRRIGDLGSAGDGICNLVHVDDVASAIVASLVRPDVSGRAFNVGDPRPGTWNEYFTSFALAIGATPVARVAARTLKLDSKLLAPPLKIAQMLASRVGAGRLIPDPLPSSLLSLWRQEIQLDHRNADLGLGFTRMAPDAAIADAASWFVAQRRL
jgi:nucleoside-diphosphate-sugar epimerase